MSRELSKALLVLFALAVIPTIFFPANFGLSYAAWAGPQLLAAETIFYFLVFFWIFPEAAFFKKVEFTFGTLTYRLLAGTLFGILLAGFRSMPLKTGLPAGWYAYFPGFMLTSLIAPFVLKGFWGSRVGKRHTVHGYEHTNRPDISAPSFNRSRTGTPPHKVEGSGSGRRDLREINFDDAMAYIGEQTGVEKAYLIDQEGLVLARFEAGGVWEDEVWAAWGLVLAQKNGDLISGVGAHELKGLELYTTTGRIYVQKVLDFYLVAVLGPQADELLNVRLVRAAEMIRRHWQEKYEPVLKNNREERYVPDLRGA